MSVSPELAAQSTVEYFLPQWHFIPLPHTLFKSIMWVDLLKILQVSRWKQNLICCLQLKPISNVNTTVLAHITKKAWDIVFQVTWCTLQYLKFSYVWISPLRKWRCDENWLFHSWIFSWHVIISLPIFLTKSHWIYCFQYIEKRVTYVSQCKTKCQRKSSK